MKHASPWVTLSPVCLWFACGSVDATPDASDSDAPPGALVPSNLPADSCERGGLGDLVVDDVRTIDTDADCEVVVSQVGGPEICLHLYARVDVLVGGELAARRGAARALAVVATDEIVIEGRVSVRASSLQSGAGGVGDGIGTAGNFDDREGGGGGSYGTRGSYGGPSSGDGIGGAAYGNNQLVPLLGGSPGGSNGFANANAGGGGALQLVACDRLIVAASGIVDAGGEGGSQGLANSGASAGGFGGGSGGGVLLEAITVELAGVVAANGGGGGGGIDRTDGSSGAAQPGADGTLSATPAAGGLGYRGGGGGDGAAIAVAATGGSFFNTGGGGGGGAGRIRINAADGNPPQLDVAIISPAPTLGVVERR